MKLGPDITAATFELFNRWSRRPDWVLEATSGDTRVRLTGTTTRPTLPGPSELHVAYVDEPRTRSPRAIVASLRVMQLDASRVHVEGNVRVDDLALELDLDAALVT